MGKTQETRLDRILRDRIALLGFIPGSVEAQAFEQGFRTAEEIITEQALAAEPFIAGPLEGSDEDKALANEYGLAMGKNEDDRWTSYRDYLRGILVGGAQSIIDSVNQNPPG